MKNIRSKFEEVILLFLSLLFCSVHVSNSRVRNAFQRQYVGSMVVLVHCWTVDGNKNRAWNVKAHLQVLRIIIHDVSNVREAWMKFLGVAWRRLHCDVRKTFLPRNLSFRRLWCKVDRFGNNRRCYRNRFSAFFFFFPRNNHDERITYEKLSSFNWEFFLSTYTYPGRK